MPIYRILIPAIASGLFLFLDQLLKYSARTHQTFSYYLGTKRLGWEYFANQGVAFSIPLPSLITTLITPFIIVILLIMWRRDRNKQKLFHFSIALIIFGAISNFIDRLAFGFTIDYIRILTGVINIADVMIVAGGLLLVIHQHTRINSKICGADSLVSSFQNLNNHSHSSVRSESAMDID